MSSIVYSNNNLKFYKVYTKTQLGLRNIFVNQMTLSALFVQNCSKTDYM